MPFKKMARNICCLDPQESDDSEQTAIRLGLEPDDVMGAHLLISQLSLQGLYKLRASQGVDL